MLAYIYFTRDHTNSVLGQVSLLPPILHYDQPDAMSQLLSISIHHAATLDTPGLVLVVEC